MKNNSPVLILCAVAAIGLITPLHALTVTVVPFRGFEGSHLDIGTALLQAELQDAGTVTVRDRNAVPELIASLERCQSGLMQCSEATAGLQRVDVMVFGEIQRRGEDEYVVSVRAVSERTWTVIYSGSQTSDDYEEVLEDLADDMNDSFRVLAASGPQTESPTQSAPYRIAIHGIQVGNTAAQGVDVAPVLNSILMSAFRSGGRFEVVERAFVSDLVNERELGMNGLVVANNAAFEARGITHYVTGTLRVYDEVHVLSYQIVNVRTGLPLVTDVLEWTDSTDLEDAMDEVAARAEREAFDVNGQLEIRQCNARDVHVLYENLDESNQPIELGLCPLRVEDMPANSYTLLFQHDDFDSLVMQVTINPAELTVLERVELPPIDLTDFEEGQNLEFSGKYQEAIQRYQSFYEAHPRHRYAAYAMYREGFIRQLYLGEVAEGRQILERVIEGRPDADVRTEAYYGIAMGKRASGQTGEANEILRMLMSEYPGSTAAEAARLCLQQNLCNL
ncbi:MAG: tetratricopeptide repeat protein [Spirochaetales bacterium]|nr:tetratricopeptide repeat protein [Leptospiraceae bacterium]MCP5481334.1 tetratricopeptide repeat protein [Spirochaetales bacterium]MCP5485772.1 tetratricopeptide repeat protein [Spirochaetales bacterium]